MQLPSGGRLRHGAQAARRQCEHLASLCRSAVQLFNFTRTSDTHSASSSACFTHSFRTHLAQRPHVALQRPRRQPAWCPRTSTGRCDEAHPQRRKTKRAGGSQEADFLQGRCQPGAGDEALLQRNQPYVQLWQAAHLQLQRRQAGHRRPGGGQQTAAHQPHHPGRQVRLPGPRPPV